MDLYFYTEARFVQGEDGNIYNNIGVQKNELFKRYLEVFDKVYIVARVAKIKGMTTISADQIVNGNNVHVLSLPYYHGFTQFLRKRNYIIDTLKLIIPTDRKSAHILRVPGTIGTIASDILSKRNLLYGVEVVGDPLEVYSKNGVKHPFRIIFKYQGYYSLRKLVKKACCALYVSEKTLQLKYPNDYQFSASNVKILEEDISSNIRKLTPNVKRINLLSIGTLDQMYKAPDVLINVVKKLSKIGIDSTLTWIGNGKYKNNMIRLAKDLDIRHKVKFTGHISDRNKIIQYLDEADIFVSASRAEGVPRVIIEAFSRGLPVIATRVGGTPELLKEQFLVHPDDVNAIVSKIQLLIKNLDLYSTASMENIEKSKQFVEEKLNQNRFSFYNKLVALNS